MSSTTRNAMIIETDLFSDVDDVGALALAFHHALKGDVDLLSIGVNTPSEWGPQAAQALVTWCGLTVPVGRFRVTDRSTFEPDYARSIAERWGPGIGAAPALATRVHRRALANAQDHTVTVVSVGFFGNLNDLLWSGPDDASPLRGDDLVRRKVRRTIVMAGWFPEGREFNLFSEADESRAFLHDWPTTIDFIGFETGAEVLTGAELTHAPQDSPIAEAYRRYCGVGNGRPSWDLLAVHAAAQPLSPLLSWSLPGRIVLHQDGSNTWQPHEVGPHRYAKLACPPERVAQFLNAQLNEIALTS